MKTNDLNPYPLVVPPRTPPAGELFGDLAYGTPILRVTDEKDAAGAMFVNGYSAIFDMFNVDSSRTIYFDINGGGWTAQLDVGGQKVSNKRRLIKLGTSTPAYWSRLSPDVLYVIETWEAAKLWRYEFAADKWTLLADLSKLLPAQQPGTAWCGSRGMSWDDNRFHVGSGVNNYIYDVKQAKLLGPFTLSNAVAAGWEPKDPNNPGLAAYLFGKSTMDSAGAVLWTADTQLIYEPEGGAFFLPQFGTPGNTYGDVHADVGLGNRLASLGGLGAASPGGIEGMYPLIATIDPANLASYLKPRRQIGPRIAWGLDSHTSYRDRTGQWVTYDLDGAPAGADAGTLPVFGNQDIFQLSFLSPPTGSLNRRIAQCYSNPKLIDPSIAYWAQPHASQAQDNRAVGFSSTYNNPRLDLYIAFLDAAAPATTPTPGSDMLAGIQFSADEARTLKAFAQYQLALAKKR